MLVKYNENRFNICALFSGCFSAVCAGFLGGLLLPVCIVLNINKLQYVVFCVIKDRLLQPERLPFIS